jgi:hypothetical protein
MQPLVCSVNPVVAPGLLLQLVPNRSKYTLSKLLPLRSQASASACACGQYWKPIELYTINKNRSFYLNTGMADFLEDSSPATAGQSSVHTILSRQTILFAEVLFLT